MRDRVGFQINLDVANRLRAANKRFPSAGFRVAQVLEPSGHAQQGQPLRLLDLPLRKGEWALSIRKDYLGDEGRAADLHNDFVALTIRRFTADWELSESDIDIVLTEVEILRVHGVLRWRGDSARPS